MNPKDILKALIIPLTELSVLLVVISFTVLLSIGIHGGVLGLLIIVLSLPPIFRYQMTIVEACAKGESPGALDAEDFGWVGKAYAFFPFVLAILYGICGAYAYESYGMNGVIGVCLVVCAHYPAALALLAITNSPLQSLNPVAIFRLYTNTGEWFWLAPIYCMVTAWVSLQVLGLPMPVQNFLQMFLMYSLAAMCGALIAPNRLIDEVNIPAPVAPLRSKEDSDLEKTRVLSLTHAYGFISRGNRDGGFKHIFEEIERDPDALGAWLWYFDKMLTWDNQIHALFFAQHAIRDMLANNENIPALKLIMRCRLMDEKFRPFREDIPGAIRAAEGCGNIELAAVLKAM